MLIQVWAGLGSTQEQTAGKRLPAVTPIYKDITNIINSYSGYQIFMRKKCNIYCLPMVLRTEVFSLFHIDSIHLVICSSLSLLTVIPLPLSYGERNNVCLCTCGLGGRGYEDESHKDRQFWMSGVWEAPFGKAIVQQEGSGSKGELRAVAGRLGRAWGCELGELPRKGSFQGETEGSWECFSTETIGFGAYW